MSVPSLHIDLWVFDPQLSSDMPLPKPGTNTLETSRQARRDLEKKLLRAVLGERLTVDPSELNIEIAARGKPFVKGCKFSISHSAPWFVVAVSDREIGVDIETRRSLKDPMALAARFFSVADLDSLKATPEEGRDAFFIRQWVAKEAALKCVGTGISEHLHLAECALDQSAIAAVRCEGEQYAIHEFALPDETPGAIAWHDDGWPAHVRRREISEIRVS